MHETTPVSSAPVAELLRRAVMGDLPALHELAARARRVEEAEKRIEEAEKKAAAADAKNRVLKYVWLIQHRCSMQHRRSCNSPL
jgi:hypothetical protein